MDAFLDTQLLNRIDRRFGHGDVEPLLELARPELHARQLGLPQLLFSNLELPLGLGCFGKPQLEIKVLFFEDLGGLVQQDYFLVLPSHLFLQDLVFLEHLGF